MTRLPDPNPPEPDREESSSGRLRRKDGRDVDPDASPVGDEPETPGGATKELLKRLAEHGVKSPRYKLEGEVARGGMGAILRVWDDILRRHLAMKVVLGRGEVPSTDRTPQLDARMIARFLEEAQVTGQLDHPGIVPVHELGLDAEGRVYFTMKLVKGRDLKAIFDLVFRQEEGWNETRAVGVILKACEAMAYAHKKGVIHRDLKPANVMIGNFGEVFVMDWGLARVLGRKDTHDIRLAPGTAPSLTSVKTERREEREDSPDSPLVTMDGDVMGTPAYMPPEQARGEIEKLSPRSDVYSLGAMLYHLLARQMPFVPAGARMTNRTVLARLLEGPPKPLHELNGSASAELVAICEKAMSRDPAHRYADTLELADDLRAYLEHRVVTAYEAGAFAELRKWVGRNKGLAATGSAALLVAILGLAWNSHVQAVARRDIEGKNQELVLTNKSLDEQRTKAEQEEARAKANEQRALDNEARAKLQGYVANIIAADASVRAGDVREARRRLDACDEGLRGWEWHHLDCTLDTSRAVLRGHEDEVSSVAFSPDGSSIASASSDKTVRIWDSRTHQVRSTLRAHDGRVTSLAFSPDGSRIASTACNDTITLSDAVTGETGLVIRGLKNCVRSVVFSPDGTRIAAALDEELDKDLLRVWDARTGEALLTLSGHTYPVTSAAYSPDGLRIVSGSWDKTVRVWNATSGESLLVLRGQDSTVESIAFSTDGSRIVSGAMDGTVCVWDASDGRPLLTLRGHEAGVKSVAVSPDGLRIASGSEDHTIRTWGARDGKVQLVLRGHEESVESVAFSPDSLQIASASVDRTVRLWDASLETDALALPMSESLVDSVAFSPDGSRIAAGWWSNLRVWDASTGEVLAVVRDHDEMDQVLPPDMDARVAFSSDGSRLLSAFPANEVGVWDAESGRRLSVLHGHDDAVSCVACSPDGSLIASGSRDRSVRLWNASNGAPSLVLRGHDLAVSCLAFDADGSRLASGSSDKTVRVWDTRTGAVRLLLQGHEGPVISLSFSPDGSRLASCSKDRTVREWNANDGTLLFSLSGHEAAVQTVAFSPDGRRIASGSRDSTVRIWDARTGNALLVVRRLERQVNSIAFSPDGSRLAAADERGVQIYETDAARIRDPARCATITAVQKAERFATALIGQLGPSEDVVAHLQADKALDDRVRDLAVRMAKRMGDDRMELNRMAWLIARSPGRDAESYAHALRAAEVACEAAPGNGFYLNTLGVCRYRVGQYESALATLTRSDELNHGEQPGDVAVLVMANARLGRTEAAQAALARLRELMRDPLWTEDPEARALSDEAEASLAGPPAVKPGAR